MAKADRTTSALTHGNRRQIPVASEAQHDGLSEQVGQAFGRPAPPPHARRHVGGNGYNPRGHQQRSTPCVLPEFQNPSSADAAGEDGVDHINIWEHGATALGQALSPVTQMPFTFPGFGEFQCQDGVWHYMRDPQHQPRWRSIFGQDARRETVKPAVALQPFDFYFKIACAVWFKLTTYPALAKALVENELPLDMWYTRADAPNARCRAVAIWGKLMSVYTVVRGELAKWLEMNEEQRAEFIPNFDFFLIGTGGPNANHSSFSADHWPRETTEIKRAAVQDLSSFMVGARHAAPAPKKSKDPLVAEIQALIARADQYLNAGVCRRSDYETLASDQYFLTDRAAAGSDVAKAKFEELSAMVAEVKGLGEPAEEVDGEPTVQDQYVAQAEVVLGMMAQPERDASFVAEVDKLKQLYAQLSDDVKGLYDDAFERICTSVDTVTTEV